jgi:hypothetical protein
MSKHFGLFALSALFVLAFIRMGVPKRLLCAVGRHEPNNLSVMGSKHDSRACKWCKKVQYLDPLGQPIGPWHRFEYPKAS